MRGGTSRASGAPKRPHGQIRQSQVVTTFGPGSMVDLPHHSVLIGGLEFWRGTCSEIYEPRLVAKARDLTGVPGELRLYPPPPEATDPAAPQTGITVFQFPEWFIVQESEADERSASGAARSRLLVHQRALTKGAFIGSDRRRRDVVPIRFVRSCRRGHLGDIDWYAFVHREDSECKRQLRIEESGTTGDISEVVVTCACGAGRPMADAAMSGLRALGLCDGGRPWLGPNARELCDEPNRLLVRTASNAYFPQVLSVIALPEQDEALARAIDSVWEHHLQYVEDLEELRRDRKKKPPVAAALQGFEDDEVLAAILERRAGRNSASAAPSVKEAEIRALTASREELGTDRAEGDFFARVLPRRGDPSAWMRSVERVVLVHRLREVRALVGFSRFEPIGPDAEGELDIGVRRAALARETSWIPAIENRGEGIFLQFEGAAIERWIERDAVRERGLRLLAGFDAWRHDHPGTHRQFPGLAYVLLHSLSHMLITSVSLECGYPASSIRERVYAGAAGYGILLFTGTPDAEGTLGGLIEVGRSIDRHVRSALEAGRLCSNDPVCAQHDPVNELERRFLLGAACHGCLLIAETSCEMQNDFLDRALVVATVEGSGSEFFEETP